MTDTKEQTAPLSPEQKYLQGILAKFNANAEDASLSTAEKLLLQRVVVVEKEVNDLAQKFVELSEEVKKKQDEMNSLNQQIILRRGQSQGLVESLLALRPDEESASEEQPV